MINDDMKKIAAQGGPAPTKPKTPPPPPPKPPVEKPKPPPPPPKTPPPPPKTPPPPPKTAHKPKPPPTPPPKNPADKPKPPAGKKDKADIMVNEIKNDGNGSVDHIVTGKAGDTDINKIVTAGDDTKTVIKEDNKDGHTT